jgi:hypothetical protein
MLIERKARSAATRAGVLLQDRPLTSVSVEVESFGLLPWLSLSTALGFALVAAAFYANRRQVPWAELVYWVGIAVLALPVLVRLLAASASRAERIGLVIVLAVGLYLVKVAYGPLAFTFPDEFAHEYNVVQVLQTAHLFQPNPIITVTSVYPGLVDVTSALATTAGLSPFVSGLIVIGAARLLLALALFVLVERITHSSRVAGVAAGLYTANPNYLFFSAEFAYESLALPLSALAVYAAIRREHTADRPAWRAWTAIALGGVIAVVLTHHLTSYALVATLWGMVVVTRFGRFNTRPAPWDLAITATVAVAAWFAFVANGTAVYLSQALGGAVLSLFGLLTLQQAPRQVFAPSSAFGQTALWQELLAVASILFIIVALPFGLRRAWREYKNHSLAVVLGLGAALYVPVQVLRLTPASWETGNRASEFLFVGVALVVAVGILGFDGRHGSALRRYGLPIYVAVVFMGGTVISWRPDLRLPRAYITQAAGQQIQPEGVAVARVMRQLAGPNNSIPTDESNAMLLGLYGQQLSSSGTASGVRFMLLSRVLNADAINALNAVGAHYVLVDRRAQSGDHLIGIYPLAPDLAHAPSSFIDPAAVDKFNQDPSIDRVADSGNIAVFDVSRLVGQHANP